MKTNIRVNNTTYELSVDSRLTLLDALRDELGLTGTKKGCDQGACGTTADSAASGDLVRLEAFDYRAHSRPRSRHHNTPS